MSELRWDHLALLTEGAGEDVHLVAQGNVMGHGDAARQGLVVRVGMDEQQPAHSDVSPVGVPAKYRSEAENFVG